VDEKVDPDLPGFADLLFADLRELNGSVVLSMDFRNFTTPDGPRVPQFLARFVVETSAGRSDLFARNEANRSRGPPYVQWVMGHVQGATLAEEHELCTSTSATAAPWRIRIDLLHNETGLLQGGTIRDLTITTGDFEGHSYDRAQGKKPFQVRGGLNPHAPSCPLAAEHVQ
jgi:hypothetical protein